MPLGEPCIRHDGDAWIVRGPVVPRGVLTPPADKSVAHRVLLLAALSAGTSEVRAFAAGEDVMRTLDAINRLGVQVELRQGGVRVHGVGLRGLRTATTALDCGNSGTTMRLLCGLLAAQRFASRLIGDASLSRRPMRRVTEPLGAMGARLRCLGPDGRPPVLVDPAPAALRGTSHAIALDSAQVRSAVLLAGLYADGPTRLIGPGAARDHLERLLAALGVRLAHGADAVVLEPPSASWPGFECALPGDPSASAFFAAWAMRPGGESLRVEAVGLNPGRRRYLELLQAAGAGLCFEPGAEVLGEPVGAFEIHGPIGADLELAGHDVVRCIDEIPALCAAAALCGVAMRVRDAGELRVKESDRIAGLARILRAFGVSVEEHADGLRLEPGARLRPAHVASDGDHRLAMTAAILATACDGRSRIDGVGCVRTSYPGFTADVARLAAG